jgi:signal transduction histidine kinase
VSDQVQALNRSAFVQQRLETNELYRKAERSEWQRLGIALAVNLGIGLLAILYAGRLEARLRRQRARDLALTSDLQRLSAKLVSAQEDERRTIARELHDEVGQVITAMKVELGLAQRASNSPANIVSRLDDIRAIAEGALQRVRDLSHLLHPAALDDLGLTAAIDDLVREVGRRHGIRADIFHDHNDARLAPEIETTIYRLVQEALTNVVKHARAGACRVSLERLPDTVRVSVEDDGSGFPPAGAEEAGGTRGLGLIGIRERVARFGGTMQIETAPGKGTRLTVELPARSRTVAQSDEASADPIDRETVDDEASYLPWR